jgi:hypothetical protein
MVAGLSTKYEKSITMYDQVIAVLRWGRKKWEEVPG